MLNEILNEIKKTWNNDTQKKNSFNKVERGRSDVP